VDAPGWGGTPLAGTVVVPCGCAFVVVDSGAWVVEGAVEALVVAVPIGTVVVGGIVVVASTGCDEPFDDG
jgi:hypothetical protein